MALTPVPAAGAKLRSSVLAQIIAESRPLVARKTSTQSVSSATTGTTLVADTALLMALAANKNYYVELDWLWNSPATPDIKCNFTVPASVTGNWTITARSLAATADTVFQGVQPWSGGLAILEGDSTDRYHVIRGPLSTAGSAGTLQFQFAQSTANASNTSSLVYSVLRVWELG